MCVCVCFTWLCTDPVSVLLHLFIKLLSTSPVVSQFELLQVTYVWFRIFTYNIYFDSLNVRSCQQLNEITQKNDVHIGFRSLRCYCYVQKYLYYSKNNRDFFIGLQIPYLPSIISFFCLINNWLSCVRYSNPRGQWYTLETAIQSAKRHMDVL